MNTSTLPPPLRQTAMPVPLRPANSVRRTMTIDVSWPDGMDGERLFIGRCRDYHTIKPGLAGEVLDEAEFRARLAADKMITAIEATPETPGIENLVGVRGGNHLRLFIKENMPELISSGAPIYLPLDDISGTALVSAFAWSQWFDNWGDEFRKRLGEKGLEKILADRINVCWGLAEGNSGVQSGGPPRDTPEADGGDLRNPADPDGWHDLPDFEGPGFRRARRIDVTRDDEAGLILISAGFQDSARRKAGGRVAVHEYDLEASADLASGKLHSLTPHPRILPFSECPGAVANTQRLLGRNLQDIREAVLDELRGTQGCTHLNDALRALAEVPKLAGYLAR